MSSSAAYALSPKRFPELTITAGCGCCPVGVFMGERGIVRHVFHERCKRRHLNVIRSGCIERLIPTVPNVRADRLKECVRMVDSFRHWRVRIRLGRVAVDLGGIEHAEYPRVNSRRDPTSDDSSPSSVSAGFVRELPKHHRGGLLALADLCAACPAIAGTWPIRRVRSLWLAPRPKGKPY